MEYIRRYGEKPEEAKSKEEIKKEREEEAKELEYKDSLNSDYTGVTKNVDNMDALSLKDYISFCDAMNRHDLLTVDEDIVGRHVKLHIQVTSHKRFKNDRGKASYVGEGIPVENIQDDFWYCNIFNERTDEYVNPLASVNTLYFLNIEDTDAAILSKEEKLVVYGQILEFDNINGKFEMLVRYYEKE